MRATTEAVEAVWRIESGRLVAVLARTTGDFAAAEDLAQDALEVALRQWPRDGVPRHPASWLMGTARHLAADRYRREVNLHRKLAVLAHQVRTSAPEDAMAAVEENLATPVHDDLLLLIFTACHPALTVDSQVALVLRTLGGLRTGEIARAFLVGETAVGQRISRAKKTLAQQQVAFALPTSDELPARLGAVLGVVYLIFNEGYAASAGDDWTRPALCQDAVRLSRTLASLLPDQAEVHGLLALLQLQSARLPARTAADGTAVLLADQDRRRWDPLLIRRGLDALRLAEHLGGGPYTIQAQIAACHVQAPRVADTDWTRVAALYTVLSHISPSPVVTLNRAVAVGMAEGPDRGLTLLDQLNDAGTLAGYPPLSAARATFLRAVGRHAEADRAFEQAAGQTGNADTRRLYLRQVGHSTEPDLA